MITIGVIVAFFFVINWLNDRDEAANRRVATKNRQTQETNAASTRITESTQVAAQVLRASHTGPEALELDETIHTRGFAIAHDSLHASAMAARLDSANSLSGNAKSRIVNAPLITRMLSGVVRARIGRHDPQRVRPGI